MVGPGVFNFQGFSLLMPRSQSKPPTQVMTIGHSNRSLEIFLQLLQAHGVEKVIDVRTIPRSRHNPQFNREALPKNLRSAKIQYRHMPGLGGLRRAHRDSPNGGWHSPSFRGFADYMQTKEFEMGLKSLMKLAEEKQIVVMCAEAVPWRCHRSLIGDALAVRGYVVEHIITKTFRRTHQLTPFANVKGKHITYPPGKTGSDDRLSKA
jgi:uncharacterized protein (DUF488 family)